MSQSLLVATACHSLQNTTAHHSRSLIPLTIQVIYSWMDPMEERIPRLFHHVSNTEFLWKLLRMEPMKFSFFDALEMHELGCRYGNVEAMRIFFDLILNAQTENTIRLASEILVN
eukprot:PhF_6_TR32395/c0_g1_i1/m.48060